MSLKLQNKCFLIVSGPSGAGKTRFINKSLKEFPILSNTVSFTTRTPRQGENHGEFYYFISRKEFEEKKQNNELLEWALVHDEYYATSKTEVERLWKNGQAIIKDIDIQGFRSVKKIYPHSVGIFIYPPSIEELKQRILKRTQMSKDQLKLRLETAVKEMSEASIYDYKIINDDFDVAWLEFKKLIESQLSQKN